MYCKIVRLSSLGPILAELHGSLCLGQAALPCCKRHGDVIYCDSQPPNDHTGPDATGAKK
jgi:hypothetical protein